MKKKLILFLCMIMIGTTIVSCGKSGKSDKKEETNKQEQTETKEENTNISANDIKEVAYWEQKSVKAPNMKEVVVSEETVAGTDVKVKVGTTPFDFKIEDFKKACDNSEFIKTNYNI